MVDQSVVPTVRTLLGRMDLQLSLVGAPDEQPDGDLDRPVRWVHSSDLADPTPFLSDEVVLLTTGKQFEEGEGPSVDVDEYVRRLVARGVLALGFGAGVVRPGVPAPLVEACARHRLMLFEVPYRTPFIAVARANAEAVAAQAYERRSWALSAQRAISLAALRPDGLARTLMELGHQLGTWVGLYDAAGVLLREHPTHALSPATSAAVDAEVEAVLRRGARAASAISVEGEPFTLQTLGRGGRLRGVLAIASAELDQEGRGVVTSVIAMAGLAMEQQEGLQRARSRIQAGVVELLLGGQTALARSVARELTMPLPPGPVQVALVEGAGRTLAIAEWLELYAADHGGEVFAGRAGNDLLLVATEGSPAPAEVAARFDARVGLSEPCAYAETATGVEQARAALRGAGDGLLPFRDRRARGVLDSPSADARAVARATLAPLHEHDAQTGSDLTRTLRAFLENDGSHEATGRALSVHRHTVRARVQAAQRLLGVDVSSFPARAELWAAFRAAEG